MRLSSLFGPLPCQVHDASTSAQVSVALFSAIFCRCSFNHNMVIIALVRSVQLYRCSHFVVQLFTRSAKIWSGKARRSLHLCIIVLGTGTCNFYRSAVNDCPTSSLSKEYSNWKFCSVFMDSEAQRSRNVKFSYFSHFDFWNGPITFFFQLFAAVLFDEYPYKLPVTLSFVHLMS